MVYLNARELGRVIPNRFKYWSTQEWLKIDDFPASIRQFEDNSEVGDGLHGLNS